MSDNTLISVVIPVYNVEKYLRRCLDSVLNQTYQDWEAICVNDGSLDNSEKILSEYAKLDSRFKIINKQNGGLSDARNTGLKNAKGKYVIFLDSDDFIHPQTLEITYELAEKKNADMVLFDFDVDFHKATLKKMKNGIDVSALLPETRKKVYKQKNIKFYFTENILFHCTERNRAIFVRRPIRKHCFPVLALYRYSLIKSIPFIRGIIMEDFPWWCEVLLQKPKTVITKIPFYFYMPNPKSILNSSRALRMIESIATGLGNVFEKYKTLATQKEFKHFNKEFLWPFTIIAMRKTKDLDNRFDVQVAKRVFANLFNQGICDKPYNLRTRKYRRRIKKFIK